MRRAIIRATDIVCTQHRLNGTYRGAQTMNVPQSWSASHTCWVQTGAADYNHHRYFCWNEATLKFEFVTDHISITIYERFGIRKGCG